MSNGETWRILIVDDSRIDREIQMRYLRMDPARQYEFAEAKLGAEGIEICRSFKPACILLDFHLPDMDGLELLARLNAEHHGFPSAVVMLTAFGGEELAVNAMKHGVMDYLPKRLVSEGALPRTVANAIEKYQLQRSVAEQRAALDRSTRRYETLLEAMPQMVWTAGADGRLEYTSRSWRNYTGLRTGHPGAFGWDVLVHPEDAAKTWDAWRAARRGAQFWKLSTA